MAGQVVMVLVSAAMRRNVRPAEMRKVDPTATFAYVAIARDGSALVLEDSTGVPREVRPEVFGQMLAALRAETWEGAEPDLLYCLTPDGWTAWDSRARFETEPIPAPVFDRGFVTYAPGSVVAREAAERLAKVEGLSLYRPAEQPALVEVAA